MLYISNEVLMNYAEEITKQVTQIVIESGNIEGFDVESWVKNWINSPTPCLGGRCPIEFLEDEKGYKMISDTISRIQSGAF